MAHHQVLETYAYLTDDTYRPLADTCVRLTIEMNEKSFLGEDSPFVDTYMTDAQYLQHINQEVSLSMAREAVNVHMEREQERYLSELLVNLTGTSV